MTREQKEIINKIREIELEEKRRKGEDKLSKYNTGEIVHQKQLAFHKCPSSEETPEQHRQKPYVCVACKGTVHYVGPLMKFKHVCEE